MTLGNIPSADGVPSCILAPTRSAPALRSAAITSAASSSDPKLTPASERHRLGMNPMRSSARSGSPGRGRRVEGRRIEGRGVETHRLLRHPAVKSAKLVRWSDTEQAAVTGALPGRLSDEAAESGALQQGRLMEYERTRSLVDTLYQRSEAQRAECDQTLQTMKGMMAQQLSTSSRVVQKLEDVSVQSARHAIERESEHADRLQSECAAVESVWVDARGSHTICMCTLPCACIQCT